MHTFALLYEAKQIFNATINISINVTVVLNLNKKKNFPFDF